MSRSRISAQRSAVRDQIGFALYEVLMGLALFAIGVLALGRAVENCLNASTLNAECAENGLRYAREHFCFDRMMRAKLDVDLALVEANKTRSPRVPNRAEAPALASIASPEPILRK